MGQLVKVTQGALTSEESASRNIQQRNLLSDALRLLNEHEAALVKGYPMALLEIFAEGPAVAKGRSSAEDTGMDFGELSLMDESEMQAQVELSKAQQQAVHATEAVLAELNTLAQALNHGANSVAAELAANQASLNARRSSKRVHKPEVAQVVAAINAHLGKRLSPYPVRRSLQAASLPLMAGEEALLDVRELSLQGLHNAANALVALALCEAIGLSRADLLPHLKTFKGLPHRVEKIGAYQNVDFIDDSKGTNVGATCAALYGLQQPIVLIAGGLGKGQDFAPLQAALLNKARAVMLIGRDADQIEAALQGLDAPVLRCENLTEATQKGFALAKAGDAVLLSPACASMDMFRDYAHRSEVFIDAYKELAQA